MALAEHAPRGLAHRRKGFRQQRVERLAIGQPFAKKHGLRGERAVVERLDRRFERIDPGDQRAQRFDIAFVRRTENGAGNGAEHGRNS